MYRALNFLRICKRPLLSLALGITYLFSFLAFALPSDRTQKIYIAADSSIYNYKTGVNQFDGHVKVDQGTSHILADKLITKSNHEHKIVEATAFGLTGLAHYRTLPKVGELEMQASAKIIKFYPLNTNVTLEQQALVTQGENSFQGELILYNSNDQIITVPAAQRGRAVLVYNPDK